MSTLSRWMSSVVYVILSVARVKSLLGTTTLAFLAWGAAGVAAGVWALAAVVFSACGVAAEVLSPVVAEESLTLARLLSAVAVFCVASPFVISATGCFS